MPVGAFVVGGGGMEESENFTAWRQQIPKLMNIEYYILCIHCLNTSLRWGKYQALFIKCIELKNIRVTEA